MAKQRYIELLAPAKNLECAREAILHGADAVYIGAPKFGARAAAGNSSGGFGRTGQFCASIQRSHLCNCQCSVVR